MEIVSKTILQQIITQCAGTQDIIKEFASCDLCGRKSGLKTVAFLLRLSIYNTYVQNSIIRFIQLVVKKQCTGKPHILSLFHNLLNKFNNTCTLM